MDVRPDLGRSGATSLEAVAIALRRASPPELAEDDEAVRGIAVLALSRAGYQVLTADSGPMAPQLPPSTPVPSTC